MVTKYEIRVQEVLASWGFACGGCNCDGEIGEGDVRSRDEEEGDGLVDESGEGLEEEGDDREPGAAPMTAFSLMMHPSPMEMGPSKE